MKTILITGGTGLIGSHLQNYLLNKGYKLIVMTRNPTNLKDNLNTKNIYFVKWDIYQGIIEEDYIKNINGIVHLAGANIGTKRWTKRRKQELYNSRVLSTRLLYDTVKRYKISLEFFISASAIGYYGTTTRDKIFNENDAPGNDFLSNLCLDWESEVIKFETLNVRTVILRTGVVFSSKRGALPKITLPIKYFMGGPIASGKQIIPWIHIDDICRMYMYMIEKEKSGIYNAVTYEQDQPSNYVLGKMIAEVLNKPFVFPSIPSFILKIIFGEMASILLDGSKTSNSEIIKEGFTFKYGNLKDALINLLK